MTQQDITELTVVPDSKAWRDYEQGDIGRLEGSQGDRWLLCCPLCRNMSHLDLNRIVQNDDGTVSSTQPLHCHGRDARQRYSIDHNRVRWL